jgi:hypothetical protein
MQKYLACEKCGKQKKMKAPSRRTALCGSCSHKGPRPERQGIPTWNKGKFKDSICYPGLGAWTRRNKLKTTFCEWCYSEDNLEAHHILPKARFPQYATDDSNCRIMCKPCHTICHQQGGF